MSTAHEFTKGQKQISTAEVVDLLVGRSTTTKQLNTTKKKTMEQATMKRTHLIAGIMVAVIALLMSVTQAMAQNSVSIKSKNGKYSYSSTSGGQKLNVEYDGQIVFADDDRSIQSISRGGYMLIKKTSFGQRREVLAEPDGDQVVYEYRVGRRQQEWNKEAEEFLADVLREVIRTTAIGAEGRVDRFYTNGGLNAVLEEVDEIRSDYVSHIYLQILIDEYELSDNELVKIAAYVPRELDSDHYISEVFKDNAEKFLASPEATNAFLSAIERMDSDHYITLILTRALREDLKDDALIKVIQAADVMDSDHYKTNVLKEVLDRRDLSNQVVDAVIRASTEIDSDHYATIVISDALDRPNLSDEAFNNLMDAISNIDSDHYVTQTFRSMLREREVSDQVVAAIIKRLEYMDSDHYRTIIINDLFEDHDISEQYWSSLLNTIDDVDSDHYATQMLTKVLRNDLSEEQYAQVLTKVANIDSDHYRLVILKDLMDANLGDSELKSILNVADQIGSDYYKSQILKEACPQVRQASDEVKDMFRKVARGIESDTYYGRVARCID